MIATNALKNSDAGSVWKREAESKRIVRLETIVVVSMILLGPTLAYSGMPGAAFPPTSPTEAMHLVEALVPSLSITSISHSNQSDKPRYYVEGKVGTDTYQAEVDARIARVLSITKNRQPFYKWGGIIVVAHRGTVKFAPENTMTAFEKAIALGADLLEMDIRAKSFSVDRIPQISCGPR